MDDKKKFLDFDEDEFDVDMHKRAQAVHSRKKAEEIRTKKNISFGKTLLTVVALVLFIVLFFAAMNALGLQAN